MNNLDFESQMKFFRFKFDQCQERLDQIVSLHTPFDLQQCPICHVQYPCTTVLVAHGDSSPTPGRYLGEK